MTPTLIDYIKIAPNPKYKDLDVKEKIKLIDASLDPQNTTRGLKIDLVVSHSVRRINNRLYSPIGQANAVKDFTAPYAKPVIKNHDRQIDPMGRFIGGRYEDTSQAALRQMRSMQDMSQLQQAYRGKDWEKLAATAIKSGILVNQDWEGMGKLWGTIRVTDKDAIEKFMDGRYLTFSSGATGNALVCSHCLGNWMTDGHCGHEPGEIIDGKPVFHITDEYHPNELSVVTHPADDLSKVHSIEWTDCAPEKLEKLTIDDTTIYITDSVFTMTAKILGQQDGKVIANSQEMMAQVLDELNGETLFESNCLVRLQDALHSQYDYLVKYEQKDTVPKDVFALHAKLHQVASAKGFRDSFINGPLDGYNASGEETTEFMYGEQMDNAEVLKELGELREAVKILLDSIKPKETVVETQKEENKEAVLDAQPKVEVPVDNSTAELDKNIQLQDDYRNALLQIDHLKRQVVEVLSSHAKILKKDFSELADTEQLAVMYGWFCEVKDQVPAKEPVVTQKIESPAVSGTEVVVITDSSTVSSLDDYQKSVVTRFKKLSTENPMFADQYITGLKRKGILAPNFDPNKF